MNKKLLKTIYIKAINNEAEQDLEKRIKKHIEEQEELNENQTYVGIHKIIGHPPKSFSMDANINSVIELGESNKNTLVVEIEYKEDLKN